MSYLNDVFKYLPSSSSCIDVDGTIVAVNQRWRDYASAGDASSALHAGVGFNYLDVCDNASGEYSEFAKLAAAGIRTVLDGTQPIFEMEYACHTPFEQQWSILQVVPLGDAEPRRFLISHIPITSTKLREEQARQQQKLFSLGLMAGGMAHDINNLLQVITAQISICEHKITTNKPIDDNLRQASQGIERTAALARQMLAYSGNSTIAKRPTNINSIIVENLLLLRGFAEDAQVQLSTNLAEELPSIVGDSDSLLQLILNLVTNAVDATAGQPNGQVEISSDAVTIDGTVQQLDSYTQQPIPHGDYVCIRVRDNNGGIPASLINSIFDPFFTTKEDTRGLGLAIVAGVIKNHNGALTVETSQEDGTSFCIYLPNRHANSVVVETQPQPKEPERALKQTVLIIDSDSLLANAVNDLLALAHIKSRVIGDIQNLNAALDSDTTGSFVVLLDMNLHNGASEEILEHLRQRDPDFPIILTSGSISPSAERILTTSKHIAFLHKPYEIDQLVATIQHII